MELDNDFVVMAPIDQVWTTMMDVERVARCVPGAQVLGQLADDSYQVGMRVKLGPVTMQYRGQLDVVERDEAGRRAVLRGKAKELRGQGTADATAELRLTQDGDETRGTVHADVRLLGRAAAMGQGIITGVADQILGQFVANLQAMLNAGDSAPAERVEAHPAGIGAPADDDRSGPTVTEGVDTAATGTRHGGVIAPPEQAAPKQAPVEQAGGDAAMTEGQVVSGPGDAGGPQVDVPSGRPDEASVSGGAQSIAGGRVSDRVSASSQQPSAAPSGEGGNGPGEQADSLDALALARGVLGTQLRQPRTLAGLFGSVALAAFWLGRRSGRRSGGSRRRSRRRGG